MKHLHFVLQSLTEDDLDQLSLEWADRTAYVWKPASDFRSAVKASSQSWLQLQTRNVNDAIERYTTSATIWLFGARAW